MRTQAAFPSTQKKGFDTMKNTEILLKEIEKEKKKAQIANIIEELSEYDHSLPAITTVYLILRKTRISDQIKAAVTE